MTVRRSSVPRLFTPRLDEVSGGGDDDGGISCLRIDARSSRDKTTAQRASERRLGGAGERRGANSGAVTYPAEGGLASCGGSTKAAAAARFFRPSLMCSRALASNSLSLSSSGQIGLAGGELKVEPARQSVP